MSDRYAELNSDNIVLNVIVWDGNTSWQPETGNTVVGIGTTVYSYIDNYEASETYGQLITYVNDVMVDIGYKYDSTTNVFSPTEVIVDTSWDDLRAKRDRKLQSSDWKVTPGSPYESKLEEWKTYRQQLRDLPANTSDPQNPIWPTRPS